MKLLGRAAGEEFRLLRDHIERERWRNLATWLVTTGMHFSEDTALTAADIDADTKTCRIDKGCKYSGDYRSGSFGHPRPLDDRSAGRSRVPDFVEHVDGGVEDLAVGAFRSNLTRHRVTYLRSFVDRLTFRTLGVHVSAGRSSLAAGVRLPAPRGCPWDRLRIQSGRRGAPSLEIPAMAGNLKVSVWRRPAQVAPANSPARSWSSKRTAVPANGCAFCGFGSRTAQVHSARMYAGPGGAGPMLAGAEVRDGLGRQGHELYAASLLQLGWLMLGTSG